MAVSFTMVGCSEGYNGDPKHDAKIMLEKMRDGEDIEAIAQEYAVDHGYGMQKAKEAMGYMSEID